MVRSKHRKELDRKDRNQPAQKSSNFEKLSTVRLMPYGHSGNWSGVESYGSVSTTPNQSADNQNAVSSFNNKHIFTWEFPKKLNAAPLSETSASAQAFDDCQSVDQPKKSKLPWKKNASANVVPSASTQQNGQSVDQPKTSKLPWKKIFSSVVAPSTSTQQNDQTKKRKLPFDDHQQVHSSNSSFLMSIKNNQHGIPLAQIRNRPGNKNPRDYGNYLSFLGSQGNLYLAQAPQNYGTQYKDQFASAPAKKFKHGRLDFVKLLTPEEDSHSSNTDNLMPEASIARNRIWTNPVNLSWKKRRVIDPRALVENCRPEDWKSGNNAKRSLESNSSSSDSQVSESSDNNEPNAQPADLDDDVIVLDNNEPNAQPADLDYDVIILD